MDSGGVSTQAIRLTSARAVQCMGHSLQAHMYIWFLLIFHHIYFFIEEQPEGVSSPILPYGVWGLNPSNQA